MIFKNEDEELNKLSKIEETDNFWNIGAITPPKVEEKQECKVDDSDTVLLCEKTEGAIEKGTHPISAPNTSTLLVKEYSPVNPLLNRVGIYTWPTKYTFYERFRLDAQRYFYVKHQEVQPVRFFSYMPGYIQMSIRQREWYFYWRDCVRNKKYLPADSSYILLYIYEIINLPELISAERGVELLCDIWENYRDSYTKLDKFLTEWLCDYCLVNGLEVPYGRLSDFYDRITDLSAFKQFYIQCPTEDIFSYLLIEKLSAYRWHKSKYVTGKNKSVFEKHINGSFAYAVKKFASFDGRFDEKSGRLVEKRIIRDAFGGSLCAYKVKRRLEIDYIDLENVNDLVFIVTDMVRYCENRVRAGLGIRSRLSVQNLTEQQKNIINEYFDANLPSVCYEKKRKKEKDAFEYPDRPQKPFSVSYEKAKEIERNSWQITDRLVEEDYGQTSQQQELAEAENNARSIESEALDIAKQALICLVNADEDGLKRIADESYMLPETLIECVNEFCYEFLGDVGIEEKDGRYVVIADYEQEIRQWLNL